MPRALWNGKVIAEAGRRRGGTVRRWLLLGTLVLAAPAPASAWGLTGHRVVGRIAERHLTPAAAQAVAELIGPQTLAQVGVWADDVRSDPAWKKADPWHYVSIDDGETYESTAKNPEGDVVEAMRRFEAVLRDSRAGREERAQALKFLVHFVADVHQPLHVGRRADRGGNEVAVIWFDQPGNLHSVWDSEIIDSTRLSFSELAEFLDRSAPQEVAGWQRSTYLDWVRESFELRPGVYDTGGGKLSWNYRYASLPVVERRLLQAGVRLAGLLNSIFARSR